MSITETKPPAIFEVIVNGQTVFEGRNFMQADQKFNRCSKASLPGTEIVLIHRKASGPVLRTFKHQVIPILQKQ